MVQSSGHKYRNAEGEFLVKKVMSWEGVRRELGGRLV